MPNPKPTGIVHSPVCEKHLAGSSHPESPARLPAIMGALGDERLTARTAAILPRPATREEVLLCHTAGYFAEVRTAVATGRHSLPTGDTDVTRDSLDAALLAVGGTLAAVDAVMDGRVRNAFCAVRPPGHHARPDQGMGFCIFNNVAIAARYAQKKHGIGKVLIADWDVHHGNGTQDIFYEDGSALFFSTHQSPLYPGTGRREETGRNKGAGCIINRPFPAGAGRDEILGAFENDLLPAAERFKPDFVFISAGFDSRADDPLGRFTLDDEDFAGLTRLMKRIAGATAHGRIVSTLEGGYNLAGLASAARAHVAALAEG